jgi:hypothetical protein
VLVLKETHANTSKPFLDILSVAEVQSLGFFWSSNSNQVLFYLITTPKIQIQHTLFRIPESLATLLFFITKKPAFTSLTYIKYTPHHFIFSLPWNHLANFLVKTWSTKLMKSFHWVAEIALHLRN